MPCPSHPPCFDHPNNIWWIILDDIRQELHMEVKPGFKKDTIWEYDNLKTCYITIYTCYKTQSKFRRNYTKHLHRMPKQRLSESILAEEVTLLNLRTKIGTLKSIKDI
jgi:hypothetical protein